MIVSGGENVFPREVEDLLADHEGVVEVAVIGVEDQEFGERLKAFVVLARRPTLSEDELKAHVKSNLAAYKTPREIAFVEELPRNATGKVLKRELRGARAAEVGASRPQIAGFSAATGVACAPPPVVACRAMSEPAVQLKGSARRPRDAWCRPPGPASG